MEIPIPKIKKYEYKHFKKLLSSDFKNMFKNKCNGVFEKKGKELGIWGHWYKNGLFGILNYDGYSPISWCWRNTPNTHPYCFYDFYYLFYDDTGIELDFDNKDDWEKNLDILFEFIEKNFELYFTTNIETKYFYHFWFRCNKSWTLGQLTIIAFMYRAHKIFKDHKIIGMDFALERGDPNDFIGVDVILTVQTKDVNKKTEKIKIQVKSGKVIEVTNDGYLVSGSANDLKAGVDYWCYVDIKNDETNIVLFQNLNYYIRRIDDNILFKKQIIHPVTIKESIMIVEILKEIAQFCFTNKILIEIENLPGDENTVIIKKEPEKIINIKIGNFKDENLLNLLQTKYEELKQLFQ